MSGSEEGAGRSISGSFCFGEFKDGGQSPELSAQQVCGAQTAHCLQVCVSGAVVVPCRCIARCRRVW
eukprot:3298974-Rhodomonas_salina.1